MGILTQHMGCLFPHRLLDYALGVGEQVDKVLSVEVFYAGDICKASGACLSHPRAQRFLERAGERVAGEQLVSGVWCLVSPTLPTLLLLTPYSSLVP